MQTSKIAQTTLIDLALAMQSNHIYPTTKREIHNGLAWNVHSPKIYTKTTFYRSYNGITLFNCNHSSIEKNIDTHEGRAISGHHKCHFHRSRRK